ncbi:hypothetical protein MFRU_011g02110 [Monilinia fructicola]|nr:hypothetical protein MFRU_011g02110 [Monilinia fructicola]
MDSNQRRADENRTFSYCRIRIMSSDNFIELELSLPALGFGINFRTMVLCFQYWAELKVG